MTTISEKLVLLNSTKGSIRAAIEAKGVTVPVATPFAEYPDKIAEISQGGQSTWVRPIDWIDISLVGANEINLLVTEGSGIAFMVTTASGTYSIDWGDGTVETARVSGTTYQHEHLINGTLCFEGYHTWKIRIYGASSSITRWQVQRTTLSVRKQVSPILEAVFGTEGLTSLDSAFYISGSPGLNCYLLTSCTLTNLSVCTTTSGMFSNCMSLVSVKLPSSWGGVKNTSSMFSACYSLPTVTLPTSWGLVTNVQAMFGGCLSIRYLPIPESWGAVTTVLYFLNGGNSLRAVLLPTSWGSIQSVSGFFSGCISLPTVALPSSWGGVTDTGSFFYNCTTLWGVTLPAAFGGILVSTSMFYGCFSLKVINNLGYLGSSSSQANFTDVLRDCTFLQGNIVIGSRLSVLGIYGAVGFVLPISSIRLTNSASTFTGVSPQVNVSYTSLGAAALNLLFGDLPTLTGKTINITGCPGAATCTRSIATAKGWTVTG